MATESFFITKEFDSRILQKVLRRNFLFVLLIFILTFSAGFFYLRYTKPMYQSSAIIQLNHDDKAKDVLNIENINNDQSINSDIELLRSPLLFEEAIAQLKINVTVFHQGKILSEEKYLSGDFQVKPYALKDSSLIGKVIEVNFKKPNIVELTYSKEDQQVILKGKLDEHLKNADMDLSIRVNNMSQIFSDTYEGYSFMFNSEESLTNRFLSSLDVQAIDPAAKTIQLNFTSYHPAFCRDMLNALVNSFFNFDLDQKKKGSENILNYIDNQLDSLSTELKTSKGDLLTFQRRTNLIDPEMAEGNYSEKVSRLQEELTVQMKEFKLIQNVNQKLRSEPTRLEVYRLLPDMFGSQFEGTLSSRITELHEMLEKKEDLMYSVTEDNPQIKTLNTRIQAKMVSIRKSGEIIQERIRGNIREIQSKIAEIQGEMFSVPEKKMEYGRLQNLNDLNEKYVTLFTEKKVMYSISDAGYSTAHRILSRPNFNADPIEPNQKKIYSLAGGMGFFLSVIFLFVRYIRFNEINSLDDLKKILPETVNYLGSIPKVEQSMEHSEIIVQENPNAIVSEALRSIRTNLNFVSAQYRTIAISSSVSSEGKTFVALNLAAILAMTGKSVLLIDLDMRRPKVHVGMGVDNKQGMSNAIIGEVDWRQCVHHSPVENLSFISAGAIPPNPSELILRKDLQRILQEMKEVYSVVVIDNPPVGVVSDGVHLLATSDVPIYVFKANFSKRNFAERVEELMEVQKIQHLNVILNHVETKRNAYGYGYGYGYGGYGYYTEEKPKKSFLKRIFGS